MNQAGIPIRRARSLEDYAACIAIQKEVWGFTDPADYASLPLLRVQNTYGGSVLVAEDTHGRICAFAYALLGRNREGRDFWWSHMAAVGLAFQGTGIGFELKLAQRREALRVGISRIDWTFDPLQARNAHFNIRKLGVIARDYEENIYGVSSSAMHHSLPTDRLLARWELESDRVADRVGGTSSLILRDFDGIVRVLENRLGHPGPPQPDHRETPLLIEIPAIWPEGDGRAREWQLALRSAFGHYLSEGYTITDFILIDSPAPHAFYVLER